MIIRSAYRRNGLSADGEGKLCISDMDHWKNDSLIRDPRGIAFELEEGITEVEEGFFDMFPTLSLIVVSKSVRHIDVSDRSLELFRRNDVAVCGEFDSYAERFAGEYGLRFVHSDIVIARAGDYFSPGGSDVITLRFSPDGSAFILQENFCQGSSAGNSGGGDIRKDLPDDFYRTFTQEDIAGMCWGTCYEKILECAALKTFLEKAKARGGYCFRGKEEIR